MTQDLDRLYELVPAVYRTRDADQGFALRALLRVIGEQVNAVERDIAGLYENWFIETCDDWVVPYIGALIGYAPLSGPGARSEVANTIRFRRRKGTLAVLRQLAESITGRPAHAVEFYTLLAVAQHLDHLRMDRGRTAELRDGDALEAIGTAFDEIARNVDVRRVVSPYARGTANIPEVGIFVWRLNASPITKAPAYNYDEDSPSSYLFSALGNDTQLFANPSAAGAEPALPLPITRRSFDRRHYGEGKSMMLWTGTRDALVPVAPERIVPADLRDWSYRPRPNQVAIDPVLGRIAFSPGESRRLALWVSYAHGSVAELGGGEYPRAFADPPGAVFYRVGPGATFQRLSDALARWRADAPPGAVIEIVDSGVYAEPVAVELKANQTLHLRAASGARPVLRLAGRQASMPDDLSVGGASPSWFVLDGITVTGRGMQISGELSGVTIRHSTLVPGWGLAPNCDPLRPTEPSLEITGAPRCVVIEHSIVGAIQIERDEAKQNPLQLHVADSILDATARDRIALGAHGKLCADAVVTMRRSTVLGRIQTRAIELAENSILFGAVHACRRQQGCIRFCYVAAGSHTPRRYECQPDLAEEAVTARYAAGEIGVADRDALARAERLRVEPEFDATRYGRPAYGRLAAACAPEITAGADDDSEMGVFHDLYQPVRTANLRRRLDEYTTAGTDAGIIFAS